MSEILRITIIAQSLLMCDTIAKAINGNKEVKVVQHTTTIDKAAGALNGCDVFLISNTLPSQRILSLIRQIREEHPQVKPMLMGVHKKEPHLLDYIEAGAAGYVLAEDSVEMLVKKVRAAYNNKPMICPEITATLMTRVAELAQLNRNGLNGLTRSRLDTLTEREREVLHLLAQNFTNRQISEHLVIEVGTVKNHVHHILKKLKVRSRHDAAAYLQTVEVMETHSPPLNGNGNVNGNGHRNGIRQAGYH